MRLTDDQLYELCIKYGTQTKLWRQKFAGLLPEVFQRRLYVNRGFGSIFEFAAKLAGMSEEQVRRVLNLGKRFENAPLLKSMLENGEVSINKLARVASIATPENQEILADQVRLLSQSAVETLVRDIKYENCNESVRAHTNPSRVVQKMRKPFIIRKNLPSGKITIRNFWRRCAKTIASLRTVLM